MNKIIELNITEKENGLKVKTVLAKLLGLSRREISRLKFNQGITVNNEPCYVTRIVETGDTVTVTFSELDSIHHGYLPETPEILYEDEDLILVNKPAGMPCHPSHGHLDDDMGTLLANYFQGKNFTIRAVGRLDKDVSGVMCYAKNRPAAARLSKQRTEDVLHKTYFAIAHGYFEQEEGTLYYGIEKTEGEKRRGVNEDSDECITDYKVTGTCGNYTLLEISIRTGKTHQIRAGMASISHPLVGDNLYGGKSNDMPRCALHCMKLRLKQPFTGEEIYVEAELPNDMKKVLQKEDRTKR